MNKQILTQNLKGPNFLIKQIELLYCKNNIPQLLVGDTLKLGLLVREGTKERTQYYEGTLIAERNDCINKTILVRRIIQGVGVEKSFLVHSPKIMNFEVKRSSKIRRAKLYFLRKLSGKATRLRQKLS